jgi:N-acetylmuramoyl-L-alanine amidase
VPGRHRHRRSLIPALVAFAAIVALAGGGFVAARSLGHGHVAARESPSPGQASPATPKAPASPTPHASTSTGPTPATVPQPRIVQRPIPFPPERRAEMRAYVKRHYGIDTIHLDPHVIVLHFTAGTSFQSAWNTFAANQPDLGELPGTCTHFIVDTDGTIYQLVPLSLMCRHTVGLNYTAFGIEDVGQSDQEVLGNPPQLHATLGLILWLMQGFGIQLRNVIGHNESLTSPYHKELYAPWRCQTHSDWNHADMEIVRADLARMARRYHLPLGPPATPVNPNC